jgi:hypothetical protein
MKRTIRLTESEFHSLVKRLVIEAEEEMAREEMSTEDAKEVAMDAIQDEVEQQTADMSSDEIMDAIMSLKKIQRQIQSSPELQNMTLEDVVDEIEGGELSEDDDLEMRKFNRRKNMKVAGGLGASAAGVLGILSQGMGYTDLGDTFIAIHDAVKAIGGDYAALLSVGGIIYALKSVAEEKQVNESYMRRNNRRNYRR